MARKDKANAEERELSLAAGKGAKEKAKAAKDAKSSAREPGEKAPTAADGAGEDAKTMKEEPAGGEKKDGEPYYKNGGRGSRPSANFTGPRARNVVPRRRDARARSGCRGAAQRRRCSQMRLAR